MAKEEGGVAGDIIMSELVNRVILSKHLAVEIGSLSHQDIKVFFRTINRQERGMMGYDNIDYSAVGSRCMIHTYSCAYPALVDVGIFVIVPARVISEKNLTHRKRVEQYMNLCQRSNLAVPEVQDNDFDTQVARRKGETDIEHEYRVIAAITDTIASIKNRK